jgi:hypothetical protein
MVSLSQPPFLLGLLVPALCSSIQIVLGYDEGHTVV